MSCLSIFVFAAIRIRFAHASGCQADSLWIQMIGEAERRDSVSDVWLKFYMHPSIVSLCLSKTTNVVAEDIRYPQPWRAMLSQLRCLMRTSLSHQTSSQENDAHFMEKVEKVRSVRVFLSKLEVV